MPYLKKLRSCTCTGGTPPKEIEKNENTSKQLFCLFMSDPQISKQSHAKEIVKKFLSKEFLEKLGRRNTYLWVQRVQILEEWYHQVVEVTLFGLLSTFLLIEIFTYRTTSMRIFNCTRTQKYIFFMMENQPKIQDFWSQNTVIRRVKRVKLPSQTLTWFHCVSSVVFLWS